MSLKFLWPGSAPAPEMTPSASDLVARDAGAKASQLMIPRQLTQAPLIFSAPLSAGDHTRLFDKAIHIFEDQCQHASSLETRARYKPTAETLGQYRAILQAWSQAIEQCARKDLSEPDFAEIENAVLFSDCLDSQIINALRKFPAVWHMAMLSDVRASLPDLTAELEAQADQSELTMWEAKEAYLQSQD